MANVLMVIAQENFRDEEFRDPKEVLEKGAVHTVKVAAKTTEICKGKLGMKVKPDLALKDADMDDFDAIVFVGGGGCLQYVGDADVKRLLVQAQKQDKVIASICLAGVVLAKAGVLKGKKATVWHQSPEGPTAYAENGVEFVEDDVVVDGKYVTGSGPTVAKEFGRKIIQVLI